MSRHKQSRIEFLADLMSGESGSDESFDAQLICENEGSGEGIKTIRAHGNRVLFLHGSEVGSMGGNQFFNFVLGKAKVLLNCANIGMSKCAFCFYKQCPERSSIDDAKLLRGECLPRVPVTLHTENAPSEIFLACGREIALVPA